MVGLRTSRYYCPDDQFWSREFVGDNIDDALAAREVGVPFVAIIARGEHGYRQRAAHFRGLGALALLPRVTKLFRILK
jgi:hypothetical protein